VTEINQSTLKNVIGHKSGCMTDVSGVVGRNSAGIHRNQMRWLERNNLLFGCVEEFDGHAYVKSTSDQQVGEYL
jgi:hypothetical protein